MRKRMPILVLAVLLALILPAAAFGTEYIHGYFRYTVADESVTITAYTGGESVVTVPSMIGSYPVNTIAAGAFANNDAVHTIILPDTIMTVEAGAFGPGQSAVYAGATSAGEPTAEPPASEPAGIRDREGNLVTADDEGNLILVDQQGNEMVLDDTKTYTVGTDDAGAPVIQSEDGQTVEVQSGSEIVFTDGEKNQVTVSTDGSNSQTVSADSATGQEEATVDESPAPTRKHTAAPTEEPTAAPTEEPTAEPTEEPTAEPTEEPTPQPTEEPTATPTEEPTAAPTEAPAPPAKGADLTPTLVGVGVLLGVLVVTVLRRKRK